MAHKSTAVFTVRPIGRMLFTAADQSRHVTDTRESSDRVRWAKMDSSACRCKRNIGLPSDSLACWREKEDCIFIFFFLLVGGKKIGKGRKNGWAPSGKKKKGKWWWTKNGLVDLNDSQKKKQSVQP